MAGLYNKKRRVNKCERQNPVKNIYPPGCKQNKK